MASQASKVLKGMGWLVAMSWYTKVLGLVSLVVMARVLEKSDFGLIASCFVVLAFVSVLSNLDGQKYLLRRNEITTDDLDIAFTLSLLTKAAIALLLFLTAAPLAEWLTQPAITPALQLLSLSPLFVGLRNPALFIEIKALRYRTQFKIECGAKTVSATISIMVVLIWQSFLAVVIAEVIYQALYTLGTYIYCPRGRRLRFSQLTEQWDFSKWLLVRSWLGFMRGELDKVIVARAFSPAELGVYSFSQQNAGVILQVLISPLNKVMYPSMSHYLNELDKLRTNYLRYILAMMAIYLPIVAGGSYLAGEIIVLVFGEKWAEATPFFVLFLLMSATRLLSTSQINLLTLIGHVRSLFWFEFVSAVVMVAAVYLAAQASLLAVAETRVLLTTLLCIAFVLYLSRTLHSLGTRLVILLLPVMTCCALMLVALYAIEHLMTANNLLSLMILITTGGLIYAALLTLTIRHLAKEQDEYRFLYQTFYLAGLNKLRGYAEGRRA